jgi:hypothetical protein
MRCDILERKSKVFFFEKKKQKTFISLGHVMEKASRQLSKRSLVFFQKENVPPLYQPALTLTVFPPTLALPTRGRGRCYSIVF